MESWTFARAVSFFLAHAQQLVVVRQRGSTLRVAGLLSDFDERDACSMDLVEAGVDLGVPGVQCSLSLHESTLLIHLTCGEGERRVFLPLSIRYEELVLEGAAPPQAESAPQPRSPYELL
jgi:hypothetical protein